MLRYVLRKCKASRDFLNGQVEYIFILAFYLEAIQSCARIMCYNVSYRPFPHKSPGLGKYDVLRERVFHPSQQENGREKSHTLLV